MKSLPREYLSFVERVLKEFPMRERELLNLEETIVACCHVPAISDVPGGNGGSSEPERITEAKERNAHYQWLARHLEAVRKGLELLNEKELEIVGLFFRDELRTWEVCEMLELDERWVRRVRTRALCKLARFFLPQWTEQG